MYEWFCNRTGSSKGGGAKTSISLDILPLCAVGGITVCYGTHLQSPVLWVRSYHQDCIIFGFSFYIQNLAKILVELEIWIFKSDPSLITCSGGREPGLAVFLFTYSSSEIPLGSRVILYTVGKVFMRRLQRHRNRRKWFSSDGEISGNKFGKCESQRGN